MPSRWEFFGSMGVQLSEQAAQDVRNRLFDGVKDILGGKPGSTYAGQPVSEFLAGAPPGNPLGDFQHRSGRAVCDRWARGERPNILPGRELYYRQLCEPYLADNYPDDASFGPPFPGGQCVTTYTVFATVDGEDINIGGQTPLSIQGPLSSPSFSTTVVGSPFPDSTRYEWVFPSDPSQVLQFTARSTFTSNPGFRVAGRVDGQPDDCGDPPSEFDPGERDTTPDPNPGPVGGPTGFPFPNVDITVQPDGTINVDFGDGQPPETIDPGEPGGDGGGGGQSGDPTDPGAPGTPSETGEGGEAEGAADEGEELVGLLVTLLDEPEGANKFGNVAETVYRGIGYVRMGYENRLGVDISGGTVISPQFFHAQQRGLTHWAVRANLGFIVRVTPYYRSIEE